MRAAYTALSFRCGIVGVNFKEEREREKVVREDSPEEGCSAFPYTIGAIKWDIYECKYYWCGFYANV